ncbi:MAG: NAD(+) synthase [Lachnospiraceae bacterium]|jgi:NAD+ synthase (glutamine-hydrolysing)|nr:NAD(+) synthase [Lachnospiraceae bacterium]MBQ5376458.1 NAD(+) synthase [Lachnospiraceae bacterium]
MRDGFIKVAAATPNIKVADVHYNAEQIIGQIKEAAEQGAKVIVFPELCITGYTCQDLFFQEMLQRGALDALQEIAESTEGMDALVFVGLPVRRDGKLYNVAAVVQDGEVLAMVPKSYLPNYNEFYEARHFVSGNEEAVYFPWGEDEIPFGTNILFACDEMPELQIGCEICEDVWVPETPGTAHALAGATVLVNLSASNETVSKDEYRQMLLKATSARLVAGYVYASAGAGESTQDLVFSGHNLILENGSILAESDRFNYGIIYSEIDVQKLTSERQRMTTFFSEERAGYLVVPFSLDEEKTVLSRQFAKTPFVPANLALRQKRCDDILSIQAYGLKKRMEHTGAKTAVIGVSGGLDSTLAMLVVIKCFDLMDKDHKDLLAVTMPCFGTTDRTYQNACNLAKTLGATLKEVDIKASVLQHFKDINQDTENHDVTYENGQARERTQVLMDLANQTNGLVIGTGDLSELALGWATYNGDHMSMYGVNAGVPKTLVRHLVDYYAETCGNEKLTAVLRDVLDTPVSPELLPPKDGVISQCTEELVGPYELHDFFLYYMLRFGFAPKKLYRLAQEAFEGDYDDATILKWEKTFIRRFFNAQFKRSCLPDGPKVGTVAVSPRGDLRMPSDAVSKLWLAELEDIK